MLCGFLSRNTFAALLLTYLHCQCAFADQLPEVARLNNEGVKYINGGLWQSAADKFADSLKIDPQYKLARINWALTELHWADSLKSHATEELVHLHKAYLLDDDLPSVLNETEQAVKALGLNPRLFADRVRLAQVAEGNGDLTGAAAEYFAALSLQKNSEIQSKFDVVFAKLAPYFRKPLRQNWTNLGSSSSTQALYNQDYAVYLRQIENKVKTRWVLPNVSQSRRAVALFDVNDSGDASNFAVEHSSHESQFDEQVLLSIKTIGNFGNLPKEAHGGLQIQIVFDYDAIHKVKRVEAEAKKLSTDD